MNEEEVNEEEVNEEDVNEADIKTGGGEAPPDVQKARS